MSQTYTVTGDAPIDFAPSGEIFEVLQNVRTIITTEKGTVPLDREFGLSWNTVDQPISVCEMMMRSEVIEAVEKYEPRARVVNIAFDGSSDDLMNGRLRPIVTLKIVGG